MTATATLHRLSSAPPRTLPVEPIVWIGGRVVPDVWVASLSTDGPLDVREAGLMLRREAAGHDARERERLDRLRSEPVTLLQPIPLKGGEDRLMPLFVGRIHEVKQECDRRVDRLAMTAICNWRRVLDGLIEPEVAGLDRGGPWTVGSLLDRLSEAGRLGLSADLLPEADRVRVVSPMRLRGRTFGSVLEGLLREHGLVVRRSLMWDGHRVSEQRTVRPVRKGRPVRLGLGEVADSAGAVESIRSAIPARRPIRLTAEAGGRVVESTFDLVGGWNPADESLPDTEYAKAASGDFDRVANVFRLWLLNEDGAYSGEPFDRGDAFDLTALFNERRAVSPQPLRFGDALTRDGAGRSVGVVVEVSEDGGETWTRHAGPVRELEDRAGVYLEDDALPGTFLDAVRSGEGRLRVTATLINPLPIEAVRWRGNPFAGAFEPRRVRVGDAFAVRRVAESSKYFEAVRAGERSADETDDRAALAAWLADMADTQRGAEGRARIKTTGLMFGLGVGDRLEKIAGRSIGLDVGDPAASEPAAVLVGIRHRWEENRSELEWRVE